MLLRMWRRAAGHEPGVVVGAEGGERDFPQAGEQLLLGRAERLLKGGVHRLFDEAAGGVRAMADGEKRRVSEGGVDVPQGDLRQVARQRSSAAVPLLRPDIALLPEAGHRPPDHDRVGGQHPGKGFRRDGTRLFRHVQQDVKHTGQSTVASHVTYDGT